MNGKQPTAHHTQTTDQKVASSSTQNQQPPPERVIVKGFAEGVPERPIKVPDKWWLKFLTDQYRCHYRDSAGRRCRSERMRGDPTYCLRHATCRRPSAEFLKAVEGQAHPSDESQGSRAPAGAEFASPPGRDSQDAREDSAIPVSRAPWEELLGPLDNLRTATGINYTLGRVLVLRAAGVIATRDAAVFAYICQLLLQSLPLVNKEIETSGSGSDLPQELDNILHATSTLYVRPSVVLKPPPESATPDPLTEKVSRQAD